MSDDASSSYVWPDVRRLCFGTGVPVHLNACVGWVLSTPHDMTGYVEGYRRAAELLYSTAVETHASPDFIVFPLAFLWRHHVELSLKDVIANGHLLAGDAWRFPPDHNLTRLWQKARSHLADCGAEPHELVNVEATIREFDRIDPRADGFRYPLDRKGRDRSLPSAPNHANLAVLQEAMIAVSNFLSAGRCEQRSRLEYLAEASR